MKFTEDTRVKIPAILHLVRLGYQYLSLKDQQWNFDSNIFPEIFRQAISKINPEIDDSDVNRLLSDVSLTLDHDDLGQAFYYKLVERSGTKLIDFENLNNWQAQDLIRQPLPVVLDLALLYEYMLRLLLPLPPRPG